MPPVKPTIRDRISTAVRALRGEISESREMTFPLQGTGPSPAGLTGLWNWNAADWGLSFPGSDIDFNAEAGDLFKSSLVMAVIFWLARNFPEAPIQLTEKQPDGKAKPIIDHPFLDLLEQPNPQYPGEVLWNASIISLNLDGNAYWRKIRNARGQVVELWYLPHSLVEPYWDPSRTDQWVQYYEYNLGVGIEKMDPADIVHLRMGEDPQNVRKGIAPLKSAVREIAGDNVAANFSYALLKNFGVVSIFIAPKDGVVIDEETAKLLKEKIKRQSTGDNRGEPIVMSAAVDAKQLAFDPEKLNVESLRHMPEHRICALLGVSPMVVGFSSGMGGSTFSNVADAREAAYENNIIPTQRMIAPQLKTQLLGDSFINRKQSPEALKRMYVGFDLSKVRVLATDEDVLHKRAVLDLRGGGITVNEYRASINLQPVPDGDVYLRAPNISPVSPDMVKQQIDAAAAGLEAARQAAKNPPAEVEPDADDESPAKSLPEQYRTGLKQTHKYSTTQFNLTGDLAKRIKAFGESIPADDFTKKGLETEPHITILYGIQEGVSVNVEAALAGVGPVPVRFGRLDYFSADEFDVLYISVRSRGIRSLNRLLRGSLDHARTQARYIPHATIGFVKPGLGEKYVGAAFLDKAEAVFNTVVFRSRDGLRIEIPLSGEKFNQDEFERKAESLIADEDDTENWLVNVMPPEALGIESPVYID